MPGNVAGGFDLIGFLLKTPSTIQEISMSLLRMLSPLLAFLPLPLLVAADVWPAFRGPDGDGIVDSTSTLPTRWSAEDNIQWRTELPGQGWSSPVVGAGRIYLSAAIPVTDGADEKTPEFKLSLLVVDAASGDLLKRVNIMDQTADRSPRIHKKNSHASPTPILSGDRVFVHFGHQGTACLTREGSVVWMNRDLYFNPTHGNGGTPILVDDRLIFTCDGGNDPKVVALDAGTGELVWEVARPVSAKKKFSFCTPNLINVDGQRQVIAPGSDCVLALDPSTGETIWDVRYDGYSVVPKPVYDNGLVFISTGFDRSKMLAIRPTGRGIVTDTHVAWQVDRNIPKTSSMIAADGLVYSISDNGVAQCVEAQSGEVVYQNRIGGNYSASPLMAGGHIYYTSETGQTTIIRTGREFVKVAECDIPSRTLASLAVVDDSLLQRTEEALYRIGD